VDLILSGSPAAAEEFRPVLEILHGFSSQWRSLMVDLPAAAAEVLITAESPLPLLSKLNIGRHYIPTESTRHLFSLSSNVTELALDNSFHSDFITMQRFPKLKSLKVFSADVVGVDSLY
jgi:hypothetical protein